MIILLRLNQETTSSTFVGEIILIKIVHLFILTSFTVFVGCSGAKDGVAPSLPIESTPSITLSGWEYEMNYSEKIVSSNSWEGTLDTQDVSEQLITANGWTVEVSND